MSIDEYIIIINLPKPNIAFLYTLIDLLFPLELLVTFIQYTNKLTAIELKPNLKLLKLARRT